MSLSDSLTGNYKKCRDWVANQLGLYRSECYRRSMTPSGGGKPSDNSQAKPMEYHLGSGGPDEDWSGDQWPAGESGNDPNADPYQEGD